MLFEGLDPRHIGTRSLAFRPFAHWTGAGFGHFFVGQNHFGRLGHDFGFAFLARSGMRRRRHIQMVPVLVVALCDSPLFLL